MFTLDASIICGTPEGFVETPSTKTWKPIIAIGYIGVNVRNMSWSLGPWKRVWVPDTLVRTTGTRMESLRSCGEARRSAAVFRSDWVHRREMELEGLLVQMAQLAHQLLELSELGCVVKNRETGDLPKTVSGRFGKKDRSLPSGVEGVSIVRYTPAWNSRKEAW